ncbi:MAG: SIS domain-containing protein [Lachnospiraceae bacterium]
MDYGCDVKEYIAREIEVLQALDANAISDALNLLEETRLRGGTIYIFGNGGSAATASHFQNDFNKGISEHTDIKYRFCCLNDNVATMMAIANDNGYENIFIQQLQNKLQPQDIVIAISGSGNSENVVRAVRYAKEQENKVIGITGYDGGQLKQLCDISLHAPVQSMQITEDIHMIFDHLMMSVLYKHVCGINHLREI